jgi:hypothetical protein
MTMLERIIGIRKAWGIVVEGVEAPSNDKLHFWCVRYTDKEIEHAFLRVSRKVERGDVLRTTAEVERYMSGVLRHEADKQQAVGVLQ